jgi:hypothetical protein
VVEHALRSKTPIAYKNDIFTNSPCNPNAHLRGKI